MRQVAATSRALDMRAVGWTPGAGATSVWMVRAKDFKVFVQARPRRRIVAVPSVRMGDV